MYVTKYDIYFPGDYSAGMPSYGNYVAIVTSYDPGGELGEFKAYMANALKDWFDGARVTYKDDEDGAIV